MHLYTCIYICICIYVYDDVHIYVISLDTEGLEHVDYKRPKAEDISAEVSSGELVPISGTWTKKGTVNIPRKMSMLVSGINIQRKDGFIEVYMYIYMCIYLCVYMNIYIYIYILVYMYIHMYTYVC
jgi:hypothetical protein